LGFRKLAIDLVRPVPASPDRPALRILATGVR
jgi:hypothetical protein